MVNGKKPDIAVTRNISLSPGSIVVLDRVYTGYSLFAYWRGHDVYFVTRIKENADYAVIHEFEVPQNRNILSGKLLLFTEYNSQKDCPYPLRKILVWGKDRQREIVLLTNHLEFGARTISANYKDRWQTEIFSKALKQNLAGVGQHLN